MMQTKSQKNKIQSGFTLIEVMISLLIFATGMLGVAYQMSQGIKNTINTKVHSSVMQVALQSIEPLSRSVLVDKTTFKTALGTLNSDTGTSAPFADNSNQQDFTVFISSALDINEKSLFSIDKDDWKPPYTVVLKISYPTSDVNNPLNFFTTHVLAPSS